MPRLFIRSIVRVFAVTSALVGGLPDPAMPDQQEQSLPDGLVRTFAAGNPIALAWWSPSGGPAAGGPESRILVLDAASATVSRYSTDGHLEHRFGASGVASGQMINPQGIAVDREGRIYVADTGADRVQVFDAQGTLLSTIGASDSGPGRLADPRALAISDMELGDDALVVADTRNGRLAIFARSGKFLGEVPIARPVALDSQHAGVIAASAESNALFEIYGARDVRPLEALAASWPAKKVQRPIAFARLDTFYLAGAASKELLVFGEDYRLDRRITGFAASPRAVLPGVGGVLETVYVADGRQVLEIGLTVHDSPVVVFEAYREHLLRGDLEGALAYIHPRKRAEYRTIYAALGDRLHQDVERMGRIEVTKLRGDEAQLSIEVEEDGKPASSKLHFPVRLVRAGGSWQIVDY